MTIAVIIPALNEEAALPRTLAHTAPLGFDRLIVVDGGSTDLTRKLVERFAASPLPSSPPPASAFLPSFLRKQESIFCCPHEAQDGSPLKTAGMTEKETPSAPITLLTSPPGRARQMNAGAAACTEELLLFLHADTLLPRTARAEIERALEAPDCVGGRFDVRFDRDAGWSRLIGRLMNVRSRWSGIATGDQAIFVRRATFERLGGFAEIPLMEDVDFTRRLKRAGRVAALRAAVTTSFRRWEAQGPLRTVILMWTLRGLFWAGVSPRSLARFYRNVR